MITLHWLYALAGAMFAAFALLSAFDRSNAKRLGNATFWGLMAMSLLGGDHIAGHEVVPHEAAGFDRIGRRRLRRRHTGDRKSESRAGRDQRK